VLGPAFGAMMASVLPPHRAAATLRFILSITSAATILCVYCTQVDVFSLGVILYQMLFGRRPFGEGQSQVCNLSQSFCSMTRSRNRMHVDSDGRHSWPVTPC
jgi:serine/threonine protein kinase